MAGPGPADGAPNPTNPRLHPVKVYGAKPHAGPSPPSPLLAGMLAGIAAAVGWALLVYATWYEFHWAAWGVGAAVGAAMVKAAGGPRPSLGRSALLLSVAALLLGKVLILEFALPPIVRSEMFNSREATAALFMIDMTAHRSFSPDLQAAIDAFHERHDTTESAERHELVSRMASEAGERAAAVAPAERRRVIREYTGDFFQYAGFFPLLARLFGLGDVLWFGLALSSAWQLAGRRPS